MQFDQLRRHLGKYAPLRLICKANYDLNLYYLNLNFIKIKLCNLINSGGNLGNVHHLHLSVLYAKQIMI